MPVDSRRALQRNVRERRYLNKDFDGFRSDLEAYARTFFPDKIRDFGPTGLGGMFIELASYVGDVQSFYLDHQFGELDPTTAVETKNIENHLRSSGVEILGASPAVANTSFFVKVPASSSTNGFVPTETALPVVSEGTVCQAENGTTFELTEDINFAEKDRFGNLKATVTVGDVSTSTSEPTTFVLEVQALCISGQRESESFSTGLFESFKTYTLANRNVTDILSVKDSNGNEYFEVEHLTQDTVFKAVVNNGSDKDLVKDNLELIPVPYRFIKQTSLDTRLTALVFGGGSAETMDNDSIPDPSEFSIPLYGKRTFPRFSLDPNNLLKSSTLGVLAPNVTVTIVYRHGGGLTHNIPARSISSVTEKRLTFSGNPSPAVAAGVRDSLDANNTQPGSGGLDPPTIDELKARIPGTRLSQNRTVSRPDLLARIYTLPSRFGRVFRASIKPNPNNPNASSLFILSKDINGNLAVAPDALKRNLSIYLNQYRILVDAIDVLDAKVVNIKVEYSVVVGQEHRQLVLQTVNSKLRDYFNVKNFEIDQPIVLSDIQNVIYNTSGVVSIRSLRVKNVFGVQGSNTYSSVQFDVQASTIRGGIIVPPSGGMFELKYKETDIVGGVA